MCVTPLPPILFTASVLALALCETLERNVFVMRFIYVTVLFVCLPVCSSGQKNKTKQKKHPALHMSYCFLMIWVCSALNGCNSALTSSVHKPETLSLLSQRSRANQNVFTSRNVGQRKPDLIYPKQPITNQYILLLVQCLV